MRADPGALRVDRTGDARASARAAVHGRLPGVGFNHEGEPACDATTFDAWATNDFADLRFEFVGITALVRTGCSMG